MRLLFTILASLLLFSQAQARTPAFDPRSWKGAHDGPATRVLTIGSPHIGQLPSEITPEILAPLLDRLAAFRPEIITHEGRSGEQCDVLKRYSARYPGMWDTYCDDPAEAEKATGLTVAAAMERVEATLSAWPANPTAAQRRQLAAYFLAANDRPSAHVQWLQLPKAERTTGDGIDPALLRILSRDGLKPNEVYDVAAPLAARLGLQRIHAVDDHTADSVQALAGPGFDPFMQSHWSGGKSWIVDENRQWASGLKTGDDLLGYFRFLNRPATQRELVSFDYKRAINTPSEQNHGRTYLAWWEIRNLRMVANIRSAFGNKPGARVLNIVGASHKAYYDAYLGMMTDVALVDAAKVLK